MLSHQTLPHPAAAAVPAARIDACLPQTQCTRCGYPRCHTYAEAIARGEADFNRCPPGGDTAIDALAVLLNRPARPLDPRFGSETPRRRAVIDEDRCIGCRKCIDVCPVDAIIGARRLMHTVIARQCSGCELCLPACPVDCICLAVTDKAAIRPGLWHSYGSDEADNWRRRNEARIARRSRPALPREPVPANNASTPEGDRMRRRAEIRAAVERARRRKQGVRQSDQQPGG